MNGANTLVKDMNDVQLRLRQARKTCADDGYNGKFCQVFNDAIDEISGWKSLTMDLLGTLEAAQESISMLESFCGGTSDDEVYRDYIDNTNRKIQEGKP